MWLRASCTETYVTAGNSVHALKITRKMFPMARVVWAKEGMIYCKFLNPSN